MPNQEGDTYNSFTPFHCPRVLLLVLIYYYYFTYVHINSIEQSGLICQHHSYAGCIPLLPLAS